MLDVAGRRKRLAHTLLGRAVTYVILLAAVAATLFPFLWCVLTSLKPPFEVNAYPPTFFSKHLGTTENYRRLLSLSFLSVPRTVLNSAFVATTASLLNLLLASLVAFGLVAYEFPGKKLVFTLVLVTMMVPSSAMIIPLFVMTRRLGLHNNYLGLIVPGMLTGFGIFLLRQFFFTIPSDLRDAARIDGCSDVYIWSRIYLPLSKAALGTVGLFTFMGHWDSFLWPFLILRNKKLFTIPLMLVHFQTNFYYEYGVLMAGALLSAIPVFCLYVFLQRYFVEGVALSGMKM